LLNISEAIELAENMPDPIPEELSITCRYDHNHAAPEYKKSAAEVLRTWTTELVFVCTAFNRKALDLIVT
jgi:hypothetical protein